MSAGAKWMIALTAASVACAGAPQSPPRAQPAPGSAPPPNSPAAQAHADGGRPAYVRADVAFMQGMIAHHAQAVVMARLAARNGASRDVSILAERIDVSQRDEIEFMQGWLRERRESVPDPSHALSGHSTHAGPQMPGMLSAEQLKQMEAARGREFDRLFLTFMIQHHQGALAMLQTLFASPGAAQDVNVFRFASDVDADQSAEIERMQKMLESRALP